MDTKVVTFTNVLRIFTVLLAGSVLLYVTLYSRMSRSVQVMPPKLPKTVQLEKREAQEYNVKEALKNLTEKVQEKAQDYDFREAIKNLTEKVQAQDLNFKEAIKNLTKLSYKVKQLKTVLKQDQSHLHGMPETADINRNMPSVSISQSTTLLTLFTTLRWSDEKETVFNNTFMNWASLRPLVNPVLLTNDSVAATKALQYGWSVINSSESSSNGLPVLKYMYLSVMKSYRSQFYCFANSDILFDGGLVKTLVNIHYYSITLPFKHVLITGMRFNVVNVNESEILTRKDIPALVQTRGSPFILSAEDYFISDRFYPWESIPEVVIASPAYDNWLVMNAREKRHLVIDASKTITVVHQSVDSNNHRSHWRDTARYNADLLKEFSKMNVPYHKGFLNCIEKFTEIADDVFVVRERMVDAFCN